MGFELCYLPEMPATLRALDKKDGSIEKFIVDFEAGPKWSGGDIHILMSLAMCATYDPDTDAFCGVRLPVAPPPCAVIPIGSAACREKVFPYVKNPGARRP